MEAKQFLAAMANLFETSPERWTHGAFARDRKNAAVVSTADNAYSFSANGFIERSVAEGLLDDVQRARAYDLFIGQCRMLFTKTMVEVNDIEGREAVIRCARGAAK